MDSTGMDAGYTLVDLLMTIRTVGSISFKLISLWFFVIIWFAHILQRLISFLFGALGLGIGMGLQGIVNNFVSGIILIFDGSLQIGDETEVNGQAGQIREIGLRASTLHTSEVAEVIIPNGAILSQNIVNWTFSNDQKRVTLTFTISAKGIGFE